MQLEVSLRDTCVVLSLIGMSRGLWKNFSRSKSASLNTAFLYSSVVSKRLVHALMMMIYYCSVPLTIDEVVPEGYGSWDLET